MALAQALLCAAPVGSKFAISVESGLDLPADAKTWALASIEDAVLARRLASVRFRALQPDFRWGSVALPGEVVERECEAAARQVRAFRKLEPPDTATVLASLIETWGVQQAMIAEAVGVAAPTVHRWLAGELEPSWTQIARLRMFAHFAGLAWADAEVFGSLPAVLDEPQRAGRKKVGAEG